MYKIVFKPIFDFVLSLFLILLLLPIFVLVGVLIWLKMGFPILFRQKRPGFKEKVFSIYKFRTMSDDRDSKGELLSDEERLKGVGKTIRSLSLDELPQLFNVLKGEMSFIGPRPLLVEYLPLYDDEQKKRHDVKPGITGWAQVNGRNAISWEEKFKLDIFYVQHQSFLLDLKIFWLTFLKVAKRSDVNADENTTMQRFTKSSIK